MKTQKYEELIGILKMLKKDRLTADFCERYKYGSCHISQILNGKMPWIHYWKALTEDLKGYYLTKQ